MVDRERTGKNICEVLRRALRGFLKHAQHKRICRQEERPVGKPKKVVVSEGLFEGAPSTTIYKAQKRPESERLAGETIRIESKEKKTKTISSKSKINEFRIKKGQSYLRNFEILDTLGVKRIDSGFRFDTIKEGTANFLLYKDKYVYFSPPVTEALPMPHIYFTETSEGYQEILHNGHALNNIENIDNILIQMTKIMDASVDSHVLIIPHLGFLLELTDDIVPNYRGKAKLVAIDNYTPAYICKEPKKLEEKKIFCENSFLDRFIGLNYGVNVRRNSALRNALDEFNTKLIMTGRRQKISREFDSETGWNGWIWEIPGVVEQCDFPNVILCKK